MFFFGVIANFFVPILSIIFCINLVSIIKKTKYEESTSFNTVLLTTSFVLITWSIAMVGLGGL